LGAALKDFCDLKLCGSSVVVLGKGPSFKYWDGVVEFSEVVFGVNQAALAEGVDYCVVSHVEPAVEVFRACPDMPILIPYYPIFGWKQSVEDRVEVYKDLEGANLYGYNAYWHKPVGRGEVAQGQGTTVHHLVHLLAGRGFKDFSFYGVDGGQKVFGKQYYHEKFRLDDKKYFESGKIPTNFDSFWPYLFQLRRKYDLQYSFA
jgi:hypothetical protein